MILLLGISIAALGLGAVMPLRWGIIGFIAAAALLFVAQVLINAAGGYAGSPLDESLLLFGGSWVSYIGFNAQITYRAFALPLLILGAIVIWRQRRTA
ncbi:hypothetical protein N9O61_05210 [Octadecabacter sp.]|nr:hypothetical protein [Octadecabacter sp.]